MLKRFKTRSVAHRLLVSILLVALVPVSFLTVHLYYAAWDDSWREIREKHQLIAENMSSPISIYINDHRSLLALLADSLSYIDIRNKNKTNLKQILSSTLNKMDGFKSLTLLDNKRNILGVVSQDLGNVQVSEHIKRAYAEEESYLYTHETGKWQLSGVKRSPLNGEPTLILSYPVYTEQNKRWGVLLGELKIELIEKLRRNVKFGIKGHSAIVDQNGRVIAHPNTGWMKEMRDISHLSVVKLMMEGKTGVTTFYSPFIKQNMVAGYTSVPEYGWGIMVPQPEGEVADQVRGLMYSNFVWGFVGIVLAIILAIFLARWINNPINRLAHASHALLKNNLQGDMGESHENDPYEVKQLSKVVCSLVSHLQHSRQEVHELNNNLQQQLRETNTQLKSIEAFAKNDYLTSLANRRYFDEELKNIAGRRSADAREICIMFMDIDNFKEINDQYGHAAGDAVLTEIARLLGSMMRTGDLVARYAGDEFVLTLHCDENIALQRAEQIREAVEKLTVEWEKNPIHTTVSIGVHCYKDSRELDVDKVMQQVDAMMYKAKKAGRNRVVKDY